MSVAEFAPLTQTSKPENMPPVEPETGELPMPETDETNQDDEFVSSRSLNLEEKAEALGQKKEFYRALGEAALKVAAKEEASAPTPNSRWQQHQAIKTAKRVEAAQKAKQKEDNLLKAFGGTAVYGKAKVRTALARRKGSKEAKNRFKSGEIDVFEYRKQKAEAKNTVVWQGHGGLSKATRQAARAENRLDWNANKPITTGVRDYRIRKAERELGRLGPNAVTEEMEAMSNLETTEQTPRTTTVTTETPKTAAELNLEKLRDLRKRGALPAPTPKTTEGVGNEPGAQTGLEEIAELLSFVEAGVDDPELYKKIMGLKGNVKIEHIYLGGHTIPGTDEWIPGEKTPNYVYETTDTAGNVTQQSMSKELAEKLLEFEPPVAPSSDTAAENPTDGPEQIAQRGEREVQDRENKRNATAKAPKPTARPTRRGPRSGRGKSSAAEAVNDNAGRTAPDL